MPVLHRADRTGSDGIKQGAVYLQLVFAGLICCFLYKGPFFREKEAKSVPRTDEKTTKKYFETFCKKENFSLAIPRGVWYYNQARLRQICEEAGGCGQYGRFFRGVCPILNRAKRVRVQKNDRTGKLRSQRP